MRGRGLADAEAVWRALALLGGSAAVGLVVVVSCVLAWRRAGRRWALFLVASYAGTELAFWVTKAVVDRPRPPASLRLVTVGSSSYPSGHTAIATAAAASLIVAARRSARPLLRDGGAAGLVALAALVGVSRMALGVHWMTDVIGGALLGVGWVALMTLLLVPAPRRLPLSAVDPPRGGCNEPRTG
jgi:undecaprenyl-diphosphatase